MFSFASSGSSWLKVVPWGLRKLLNWIKNEYGNPPLYITENGVSDKTGTLDDSPRINFYRDYINNVLKGIYCIIWVDMKCTAIMWLRLIIKAQLVC